MCVCFSHSQSAHEFRWILVPGVTRVSGVTTPRLHHQPVLDINVQGVFRHHLQNESILEVIIGVHCIKLDILIFPDLYIELCNMI